MNKWNENVNAANTATDAAMNMVVAAAAAVASVKQNIMNQTAAVNAAVDQIQQNWQHQQQGTPSQQNAAAWGSPAPAGATLSQQPSSVQQIWEASPTATGEAKVRYIRAVLMHKNDLLHFPEKKIIQSKTYETNV